MNKTISKPFRLWNQLYSLLIDCGEAGNPKELAQRFLDAIPPVCAYDQALVYLVDGNGKIQDQILKNIDKSWSNMYIEYYSHTDDKKYSYMKYFNSKINFNFKKNEIYIHNWKQEESADFIPNYIKPRGVCISCAFVLTDMQGSPRTMLSMDRLKDAPFTNEELDFLRLAVPLLNDLNKNFYFQQRNISLIQKNVWESSKLTARESQIAELLCQGVLPANISSKLNIAPSTTKKHIAHIYTKLHVTNLQELLVRLLHQSE
ncbi:MAG: response regulator transcription factor [Blautia sp.]